MQGNDQPASRPRALQLGHGVQELATSQGSLLANGHGNAALRAAREANPKLFSVDFGEDHNGVLAVA